jgi:hypothetical protein
MNTDHINYQQQIAQSVNEEKDHESLDKIENAPKQQLSSSSSSTSIGINQTPTSINNEYQRVNQNSENNMHILTATERRERIFTLLIIAFIALLTGNRHIFSYFRLHKISMLRY